MPESSKRRVRRRSRPIREQEFPVSLFGECVIVVTRGIKPGQWLAKRACFTERHANLVIEGKRKINARALHALNSAFFDP